MSADRPDPTQPFTAEGGRVGVLFLHGFTSNPSSLRAWAEAVAQAGYAVSLPRLPGHGTSWQELARTSWADWYAAADRSLTELRARCDQVFVASLSMGGALSLLLAEQRTDDVAGLVLVNPALHAASPLAPFAGLLRMVVPSVGSIGSDILLEGAEESSYDRTPVAAVDELNKLWRQVKLNLDLVTCPLAIFRSSVDHVVPPASVALIRRQTSSLEISETVLENSWHVATLDHDAPVIIDGTLDFLAAHAAVPAAQDR